MPVTIGNQSRPFNDSGEPRAMRNRNESSHDWPVSRASDGAETWFDRTVFDGRRDEPTNRREHDKSSNEQTRDQRHAKHQ